MASPKLIVPESAVLFETRPYRPEDRPAWETARDRREAEGWYVPDPEDPINVVNLVVTRNGRPFLFGHGRITAEIIATSDPFGATPAERWRGMQELVAGARVRARQLGLREIHMFPPRDQARSVERFLSLDGFHLDDRVHLFVDVVPRGTEGKK